MHYRSLLLAGWLAGIAVLPAAAHEVQIAEDVGAMLHIEPNDIAQAGDPTDVWFALTQAGGTVIPLADCDCQLTVYDGTGSAIATPNLTPISAEGFNDIPSATVTFPEVGSYELVLAGTPAEVAQFTPFELRFAVTVASRAAGAPPAASTADTPTTAAPESRDAPVADGESAAATDTVVPPAETSSPLSTSTLGRVAAIVGGAIVVLSIGIAFIGGRRSPGGKQ